MHEGLRGVAAEDVAPLGEERARAAPAAARAAAMPGRAPADHGDVEALGRQLTVAEQVRPELLAEERALRLREHAALVDVRQR